MQDNTMSQEHSRPTGIGGKPLKTWPFHSVFGLWDGAGGITTVASNETQ